MEYLIIFLPLIGAITSGFFGKYLKLNEVVVSSLVLISAFFSIFIFYQVIIDDYSSNKIIFNWINSGNFIINWLDSIICISNFIYA